MATELPIARKIGEGVDKPNAEQELPIDINFLKLVDFLISRQKLPNDWHKRVAAINQKAAEAVKDTPASVLSSLPGGADAPVDYLRAVAIRDQLLVGCEKTLFGGLTGAAAVWDKIVKAYENKCVFLGESAQLMERNVNFEIPELRKQGASLDQQVSDYVRKHAECLRGASQAATNFKQECESLGIQGNAVRSGLHQLATQLSPHFEHVLDAVQSSELGEACSYYRNFCEYAHGAASTSGACQLLTTLTELREGRTQAPSGTNAAAGSSGKQAAQGAGEPSIDWGPELGGGGAGVVEVPAGDIDWDLDLGGLSVQPDEGAPAAEVNWDIDLSALEVGGAPEAGDAGAGEAAAGVDIDWDVALEVAAAGETAGDAAGAAPALDIDWDLSGFEAGEKGEDAGAEAGAGAADNDGQGLQAAVEVAGSGVGGPRAAALARLEEDVDYRSRLQDDLQELRAFLVQRRVELRSVGNELLTALLPQSVQAIDASNIGALLAAVDKALAALTSERLRHLLMLKTSKKYFERMAASLERKAGQESRLLAAAKDAEARGREAQRRLAALAPRVTELVNRTRQIKAEAERAVSKLFAGRKVNILGDINTVLSSAGL